MSGKLIMRCWLVVLLLILSSPLLAGNLIMVRSQLPFEKTERVLKRAIEGHGYSVLEVNSVDLSLVSARFTEAKYKAVTLASDLDTAGLLERHPELAPYLPLRIIIFAENETSVLVSLNPVYLKNYFAAEELEGFFWKWNRDLHQILSTVQTVSR